MGQFFPSNITIVDLVVNDNARMESKSNALRPVSVSFKNWVICFNVWSKGCIDARINVVYFFYTIYLNSSPVIAIIQRLCFQTIIYKTLLEVLKHSPKDHSFTFVFFRNDRMKTFLSEWLHDYISASKLKTWSRFVDPVCFHVLGCVGTVKSVRNTVFCLHLFWAVSAIIRGNSGTKKGFLCVICCEGVG
jgi:hypothetical protein